MEDECHGGPELPRDRIADAGPVRSAGFDRLVLSRTQLKAVMQEYRYASQRTILSSYLAVQKILDSRNRKGDHNDMHFVYLTGVLYCGICDRQGRASHPIYSQNT